MKLTAAEYARGLMSWTPIEGLTIRIGTASKAGDPITWSEALTDPNGSLVPIDIGPTFQLRFEMASHKPIVLAELRTKLERVTDGVVMTRIFHGMPKTPMILRHVPDYGTYHRLVVDAGTLDWGEDVVFREIGILVRFVTGELEGERISALKAGVDEQGKPTLEGEQGTAKATGRFIEIVTPGPSPQQAEQQAYAALGLLAVGLGPNVIGAVVFSEPWEASPTDQLGAMVAKGTAFARKADAAEIGQVDTLLARLSADGPVARSVVISLRWYERGLRATAPLDMLLSFFIGIETLVSAYAKANAPIPVETARAPENDAIIKKIRTLGQKVVDRVSQRLRGTSNRDQFDFYSQKHGLGAEDTARFDKTKRLRDRAVHGDAVEVTLETAHEAEELLRSMLKGAFDLRNQLPWEKQPLVRGLHLEFALVSAQKVSAQVGEA
jgi:hypothetical protein